MKLKGEVQVCVNLSYPRSVMAFTLTVAYEDLDFNARKRLGILSTAHINSQFKPKRRNGVN